MMRERDEMVRCAKCAEEVLKADLEEHVRDELDYFPLRCYLCHQNFSSEHKLRNHFGFRHSGKKVLVCAADEDFTLDELCKEWVRKSLEGQKAISQRDTDNVENAIDEQSQVNRGEEEELFGNFEVASVQELVREPTVVEEMFGTAFKEEEAGTFEEASLRDLVREPAVDEESFETVLKKELFDDGVPETSAQLQGKEKLVRKRKMGSEKKKKGTEEDAKSLAKAAEETKRFYNAVYRMEKARCGSRRDVNCTLCNWTLTKTVEENRKRSITSHVSFHLGTKVFSCSQCNRSYSREIGSHYSKSHRGMKPPAKDLNFVPGTGSEMLETLFRCFPEDARHKYVPRIRKRVSLDRGTTDQSDRLKEEGKKQSTKEQELFYAAISRIIKTKNRQQRELSCALCEWTLPKERFPSLRYYATRHVSKHLGKGPFSCSTCGNVNIGCIVTHYNNFHRGIKLLPCDKHFAPGIAKEMLETLLQCFPHVKEFKDKGDEKVEEARKDSAEMDIGTSESPNSSSSSKLDLTVGSEYASRIDVLSPGTSRESQTYAAPFKGKSKEGDTGLEQEKAPLSPSTSAPPAKRIKKRCSVS